eukprot:11186611-Lingulodinium_polyedra.AAC.1
MLDELLQRDPVLLACLDLCKDFLPVLGQGRAARTRVRDQLTIPVNNSCERNELHAGAMLDSASC